MGTAGRYDVKRVGTPWGPPICKRARIRSLTWGRQTQPTKLVNFPYEPKKFVAALGYFASQRLPELSKLKAAKLLYFCDKYHLLKYGAPVLGDQYFCLDNGPVPSASLNLMNEVITPVRFGSHARPLLDLIETYIGVNSAPKFPEFTPKRDPDLSVFSGSEIEALKETVRVYGQMKTWDLRELSHKDPTWFIPDGERAPGGRADIPYSMFFEGQPESVRSMMELINEESEQQAFADRIAR